MRALGLLAVLVLCGCMTRIELSGNDPGLRRAAANFPPLIIGANTRPTDGSPPYARSCPLPGGVVEQKGGPTFQYLGASPTSPDLCRMRVGTDTVEGWYAIWLLDWPGKEMAYPALTRLIRGRTGDVEGFDVPMIPGVAFHDLIRNEGVEDINLLGKNYRALKLAHYREGIPPNIYRSVSTVWKDLDSGMLIYATYQHISGRPELDDPLIPTRIAPAR
ncbi:MAG TPA: hypothetical protein VE650_18645 [Acetobacteraceae bacterium]|nr:hypothetical protein [Acetobacteraceae bacterium]